MPPTNSPPLNNRYELLELIGRGAMGRVHRAKDTRLGGAVVAVKFLAQTLNNQRMRERFWAEASTCAQLGQKSIHIVRVTDYDLNEDDVPFYVMEYLEGHGLNEIIRKQTLPLPKFLSYARQICQGLQTAHNGIEMNGAICPVVHRDVKPSNIWITQDPSFGELVKVLDFGISKLLQEDSGQTSTFMGTMVYSSPEQMEGRELDSRSDIYSLGVMMYEMLTGELPIQADTHSFGGWLRAHSTQVPRSFNQVKPGLNIPKAVEDLILACLAKEMPDRPQTMGDILKALEPIEARFQENIKLSSRIGDALNRSTPSPTRERLDENETIKVENRGTPPTGRRGPADRSSGGQGRTEAPLRVTGSGLAADALLRTATWPKDRPIAQIVFPRVEMVDGEALPCLWVMLESYEEIKNIKLSKLYNRVYKNFLCLPSPHPTVAWLTAFYNQLYHEAKGPRWLPCYLDLKTPIGQNLVRLLGEKGEYQLLFFAQELPQKCAYVTTIKISPALQNNLKEWSITSAQWRAVGEASLSKKILKDEFDKLKPRITTELKSQANNFKLQHDTEQSA
jgi:eukaryotic-like serine/threonine-protein kinase